MHSLRDRWDDRRAFSAAVWLGYVLLFVPWVISIFTGTSNFLSFCTGFGFGFWVMAHFARMTTERYEAHRADERHWTDG